MIDYDSADVTTEAQATEILKKAMEYQQLVETWIAKNHPKCKA